MKKILFGVAALGLLGLAGAGLGLKAQDAVEAKAADTDVAGYYLVGEGDVNGKTLNSYDASSVYAVNKLIDNPENANEWMIQGVVFSTIGKSMKIQVVHFDGSAVDSWDYKCASVSEYGDTASSNYINVWDDGDSAGIYTDNGIRVFDIYINKESKNYHFAQSSLKCKIGLDEASSTFNGDNEDELKFSLTGVTKDTSLSIYTCNDVAIGFTNSKTVGTNLNADNQVIVGGSLDVYINRWTYTISWVSGYYNLHSFVSGFLTDAVDTDCATNPSTTIKEEETTVWNWYATWHAAMNDDEKDAFQAAVTAIDGDPSSWETGNELSEAAARYVYLAGKYSLSFAGVSLSPAKEVSALNEKPGVSGGMETVLITASVALVACLGAFFIVRKKKAE